MLKFNSYTKRDLQHFYQLLVDCESQGVLNIQTIKKTLHEHLYKQQKIRPVRKQRQSKPQCPSCKKGALIGPYKIKDLVIIRCSKKCGYSEVIA